ncbi:helix-turn-helix domain-containing protein [Pelagerythrobacter rhizovicinus]|nr:hypothetical protein [Pelagerythrobacter rhizovicinus]
MAGRNTRLEDIAKLAGVSISTAFMLAAAVVAAGLPRHTEPHGAGPA